MNRSVSSTSSMLLAATLLLAGCAGTGGLGNLSFPQSSRAADGITEEESLATALNRARKAESRQDWEKAAGIYKLLIERKPDDPGPYHRLGVIADRQGRHEDSQRWLSEAIQRDPRNAEIFNDLGYCFLLQGKLTKAESAVTKAVALDDERPKYKNNLGLVYAHQGRHAEALATFDQAGSKAEAHYNLAYVLGTQGDAEGASQHMQLALDANPQHEAAREALAALANLTSDQDTGDGREGRKSKAVSTSGNWVQYSESGASSNELAITDLTDGSSTESLGAQLSARSANRSASTATRTMHERARATLRNRVAAAKESVSDMAPPLSPVNHVQ